MTNSNEFIPANPEQVEEARKAIARHLARRNQKDKSYEKTLRNRSSTDAPDAQVQGDGKD